jgi:hypothetical protein
MLGGCGLDRTQCWVVVDIVNFRVMKKSVHQLNSSQFVEEECPVEPVVSSGRSFLLTDRFSF